MAGRAIVISSWVGDTLFAITAIPAAFGVGAFDGPAIAMALILFAASIVIWVWAFAVAIARNSQGDDIVVGSMFFTVGGAPRDVRWHLFGAFALCLAVTFGTASADPFGVLVPMLPVGFVGLWAARHGTFPPRVTPIPRRR